MYDNDPAGIKGKKSLTKTFGRPVYEIVYPVRENREGKKLTDVNDLYEVGYDCKAKWDKILSAATEVSLTEEKVKEVPRFIHLDRYLEYYDTKYKRIQKTDSVAAHL